MNVMFIVFILSIPVYLVGMSTQNKMYAIATAVVMAIISANTGSPKYLYVDLIGIAISLFITLTQLKNREKNQ